MKIAIIPARGGSKRVPRKNIKLFAGKPMIAYAIDAAKASGLFEHIVVSTDDEEIAAVARQYGALTPFMRPPELADDYAATVPVVAHAIAQCLALGWQFELACCIYPGVPLLRAQDLRSALTLLEEGGSDYVFPIAPFPSAIQRALRRAGDGCMQPFQPEFVKTRTQDLEPAYYDAGQFYWGRVPAWLAGTALHSAGKGLIIPESRACDIDTPDDWARAEMLFKLMQEQGEAQ